MVSLYRPEGSEVLTVATSDQESPTEPPEGEEEEPRAGRPSGAGRERGTGEGDRGGRGGRGRRAAPQSSCGTEREPS